MSIHPLLRSVGLAICALATHASHAQHTGDISPAIVDGAIVTNRLGDDGQPVSARVFTVQLGDTGVPHFAADPGYDAPAGTFPSGMRLGWKATAPLRRWNGSDFVATDAQVRFSYLTASFTVASAPVTGFTLLVQSSGGIHRHLSMTLSGAGGAEPAAGAYLAEMQMFGTSPAIEGRTYWLLFNESLPSETFAPIEAETRARLEPAACFGDVDGSGEVDNGDVAFALLDYGPCAGCPADLDATGEVDFGDIALILLSTGPCP